MTHRLCGGCSSHRSPCSSEGDTTHGIQSLPASRDSRAARFGESLQSDWSRLPVAFIFCAGTPESREAGIESTQRQHLIL